MLPLLEIFIVPISLSTAKNRPSNCYLSSNRRCQEIVQRKNVEESLDSPKRPLEYGHEESGRHRWSWIYWFQPRS